MDDRREDRDARERPQRRGVWRTPERVFLVLGGLFGVAFALATPPFDAPDEPRHFARAVMISEGRWTVPGRAPGHASRLPREVLTLHPEPVGHHCTHSVEDLVALALRPPNRDDRVSSTAMTTSFSPLAYLPQAFAISLGRAFGVSTAGLLYAARLANLACFLALAAWAIRQSPRRKWALTGIALTPTAVFLSGSVTADAVTTGLALVFFAAILRASVERASDARGGGARLGGLGGLERAGLIGLAAAVGLAKPGYWLLAALALAIPRSRFDSGSQRRVWLVALAAAILVPSLGWAVFAQLAEPVALGPDANAIEQIRAALAAPWQFAATLFRTIWSQWIPWTAGFVGVLGWLDVVLPLPLYFVYPVVLIALAFFDAGDDEVEETFASGWLVVLFLAGLVCLLALAYAGWNAVGAPIIADVHGRYFLPLAPVLALAIPARRNLSEIGAQLATLFLAASLASALLAVVGRYY